ncbi:unnamed protein product, partial [Meganyctiphanes norvegica]
MVDTIFSKVAWVGTQEHSGDLSADVMINHKTVDSLYHSKTFQIEVFVDLMIIFAKNINNTQSTKLRDLFFEHNHTNISAQLLYDIATGNPPASSLVLMVVSGPTNPLLIPQLEDCIRKLSGNKGTLIYLSISLNVGKQVIRFHSRKGNDFVSHLTKNKCSILNGFVKPIYAWWPPSSPKIMDYSVLTVKSEGLLLYSGPLSASREASIGVIGSSAPLVALQIVAGRPQLLLDGPKGSLSLLVPTRLDDGEWHDLNVKIDKQGASLMVDMCGRGWSQTSRDSSHCVAKAEWMDPRRADIIASSEPLQLGGLPYNHPDKEVFGWSEAPTRSHLLGCLSHLTINGEFIDLGEPAYSHNSNSGCNSQRGVCLGVGEDGCGMRGECVGGLNTPRCLCQVGWAGSTCDTPTIPATLGGNSYVKLALNFTPDPYKASIQLRVRTRGQHNGLLLQLAQQHHSAALKLHIRAGVACLTLVGRGSAKQETCLTEHTLGDGTWHLLHAERHGDNLLLLLDDADGTQRNQSLPSMSGQIGAPQQLHVDQQEGVTVGGTPDFVGVSVLSVQEDLRDSCVSDVRIDDRQVPLPPAMNGSRWGQVSGWEGLRHGCQPPGVEPCSNTACSPPFTCQSNWDMAQCSCGMGKQAVGSRCVDVDECLGSPCLHGGSCINLKSGYLCACGPSHAGDHCQWQRVTSESNPLMHPAIITALVISIISIVLLVTVLTVRYVRIRGRDSDGFIKKCRPGVIQVSKKPKSILSQNEIVIETIAQSVKPTVSSGRPAIITNDNVQSPGKSTLILSAADPLLAQDDLRAYAYEGEGSSAASLSSALSGLHSETSYDLDSIAVVTPEFGKVIDLLKNLPDATSELPRASKLNSSQTSDRNVDKRTSKPNKVSSRQSSPNLSIEGKSEQSEVQTISYISEYNNSSPSKLKSKLQSNEINKVSPGKERTLEKSSSSKPSKHVNVDPVPLSTAMAVQITEISSVL